MQKLRNIRQVFLDMDGTIYHGGTLFPTTIPFLNFLKERGIGYAFLSNNSSYSTAQYVERLARMGITVREENFYLSTDYTIDYLHRFHPETKRLFILGMRCIFPAFEQAGFVIDEDDPQAVIIAFDRTLVYDRLCRAAYFLRQGVPGFATHPDVFCPTDQPTWLVDCGAITAALEKSTGKILKVLGKPDPGLLIEAANRKHVPIDSVLMIGDRLSTDIAVGVNAGALTCHIAGSNADLVIPEGITPDITVANLGELQKIWQKEEEA